jgi:ABC-type phosphate transport system substrate-binding protein
MQPIFRKCILMAALVVASTPALAGTTVIVSAKSKTTSLSKDQVAALYLGRSTTLPDGDDATLYDLVDSNPAREHFYQAVTGKSASQVKAVWSRLVFSGRALPPHEQSNDAAVVKAVAADPNAVGYVDSSAVNGSVKSVMKLP